MVPMVKQDRSKLTHHTYTRVHYRIKLASRDMTFRGWTPVFKLASPPPPTPTPARLSRYCVVDTPPKYILHREYILHRDFNEGSGDFSEPMPLNCDSTIVSSNCRSYCTRLWFICEYTVVGCMDLYSSSIVQCTFLSKKFEEIEQLPIMCSVLLSVRLIVAALSNCKCNCCTAQYICRNERSTSVYKLKLNVCLLILFEETPFTNSHFIRNPWCTWSFIRKATLGVPRINTYAWVYILCWKWTIYLNEGVLSILQR